jgi:AcrR family transcriptional regulator
VAKAGPKVAQKRVGSTTSKTRAVIVDAAGELMLAEGYAAITFRSVAARAGVATGLVQYYFPSLDDLFLALIRQGTEHAVQTIRAAAESAQPLRLIWKYANNADAARMLLEYMALANHRKLIADELGKGGELVRRAQLAALKPHWSRYKPEGFALTPQAFVFMLNSLPRMALLEKHYGTTTGHADTKRMIERFLDEVEPKKVAQR